MKEQFTTYNQALELKKLNFDEVCLGVYLKGTKNLHIAYYSIHDNLWSPTYQQAFDWLLNKLPFGYGVTIMKSKCELSYFNEVLLHRNTTKIDCLDKLIELVKTQ